MGEAVSADTVWQDMQTRGIEFVFAQFVDMYARPSAKLVPVDSREAFDGLLDGRRRLRGLRRRRDRPGPERSRHRCDPRPRELHARSLGAEPRALRLRRHGRGRGVAVLPADDPPPDARDRAGEGVRVQDGPRARVLPRQAARGRLAHDRRPVRHAREALLRHGRADAALRLPDASLAASATTSAGATTRTTTRTRTGSSSRTSPTRTRSRAATGRSSSATWCTCSRSRTG